MQNTSDFSEFFQSAPPEIDPGAILRSWQALDPAYGISARRPPIPVWARRPYTENGVDAWQALQGEAAANPTKGLCLYVHIPFCEEKCAFCDCYSFRLNSHFDDHVQRYVDALRREAALWGHTGLLSHRPISTVHFGGGTPLFLGPEPFRQLVETIREAFSNRHVTEWALETTSSALTPAVNDLLSELDFKRIHVGVQTLEDPLRALLRRRETGAAVVEKIQSLAAREMVVSVDLIYGLPQQRLADFLADIRCLADSGVDGFSLYPLQISSRNRGILKAYGAAGKNLLHEFWMLQAAEQLLARLGYRKTLFNHYARAKDTNLYFTFPERGEDCLALGAIADGVLGSYHYRHPEYYPYLQQSSATAPALQGGLRRSPTENRLFPLEVAILSGQLRKSQFIGVLGAESAEVLFSEWLGSAFLQADHTDADCFYLTASGSWFAGAMMSRLG